MHVDHNQQTDDKLGKLSSKLVSADAKPEVSHTAAKLANQVARQAADAASKSMELAQNHQKELRAVKTRLVNMTKTQNALAGNKSADLLSWVSWIYLRDGPIRAIKVP